jgi:TonB-dependent receptor
MRKCFQSLFLITILFNVLWVNPAAAQEGKGSVTGTVKDSSGGVLKGALLDLEPSAQRGVSDDQGKFKITDIPAGQYTLTVSYVGLANFTQTVNVAAGQSAGVDAVLNIAGVSDQMVVTAERIQGEAEAINIERTADDIVQVLPLSVIHSLPNTNIADAVGRLPSVTLERDEGEGKYLQIRGTEPRLSNFTINGVNIPSPEPNVRNIKLDVIPSTIVDRIEVYKTLSANQDADAIGGSVNLVTKTAGEKPTVSMDAIGGYTPIQSGRWLDSFNGSVGQRFGAGKKFGLMFGGTYDWNSRGIDDTEPGQGTATIGGTPIAVTNTQDVREYQYYRTRYGFATGLDYRLSPGSNLYAKGVFSDFQDFGDTWVYTFNPGNPTAQSGGITNFDNTGGMAYRHYIRRPDQQIMSFSTGGRHDLSSTLITYEFAISRSHQYGGFLTTNFNDFAGNQAGVAFNLDNTNPLIPKFTVNSALTPGINVYDPTQYFINQQEFIDTHSTEMSLQGSASMAQRYKLGSHLGTFEMGFKVRNSDKNNFSNNPYYSTDKAHTQGIGVTLSQVLTPFTNPNYYGGQLKLGPVSDYNKIISLVDANLGAFQLTPTNTAGISYDHLHNDSADYSGTERVVAAYLMNSISFGNSRLQAGVRIEETSETYTANLVQTIAPSIPPAPPNPNAGMWASTTPTPGGGTYIDVLPSVQWQYNLPRNTDIRANYSMSIARPNFSDLVPSVYADPNGSPKSLALGNPNLLATKANNVDVLVEHFFQPLGILQAGFFYKDLSNPIYGTTSIVAASDPTYGALYAGYQKQQSINGPNANIEGFEAMWEQRLSFLPGVLNGFGVSANYGYTTSQVTFPTGFNGGRIDHPTLQRTAPNSWNLGFTYDKSRFSMRFGVSHNDANIYAYNYATGSTPGQQDSDPILGLKGPTGDIYQYSHTQVDIQGSYRMYKNLQLVVSGLNLTNEVFGFYQGSPIYPIQREFYKPSVMFGMRYNLGGE